MNVAVDPEQSLSEDRERLFWAKVTKGPTCWTWNAATTGGYGAFNVGGELPTRVAHRIAWLLLVGSIPDGKTLDHLCRNRACVNPAHLEPVSIGVNVLRGEGPSARAARATRCHRGHVFNQENTRRVGGQRWCRLCDRDRARRYRAEKEA